MKYLLIITIFIFLLSTSAYITYTLLNHYSNEKLIEDTTSFFEDTTDEISNLGITVDDANVIGLITIDKINFNGLIYEGTSADVLKKGVGHFECSPITKR